MNAKKREEIEILKAEIENVRRNRYMTGSEKAFKIKQLEKLIAEI
jgi:hypothetical protein